MGHMALEYSAFVCKHTNLHLLLLFNCAINSVICYCWRFELWSLVKTQFCNEVIHWNWILIMESLPLLDVQRRPSRPRSIVTIEPALFLYCLYTAGTIPIYSQFVRSQLERRYNSPSSSIACSVTHNDSDADHIDAEASIWLICVNVAGMVNVLVLSVIFIKKVWL